jgi:hypothetical protein
MRFIVLLGSVMVLTVATPARAGCEAWLASHADYGRELEEVLEGDPDRYLSAITTAIELRIGQDQSRLAELRKALEARSRRVRVISVPGELATQHRLLADYLDSVVAAVAAVETRDLPYDQLPRDELIFRLPTRRCYEALLEYYRELLRVLERHECDQGDVEALRTRYIPKLEDVLTNRFTGDLGR